MRQIGIPWEDTCICDYRPIWTIAGQSSEKFKEFSEIGVAMWSGSKRKNIIEYILMGVAIDSIQSTTV
jgi:hypothetical protein